MTREMICSVCNTEIKMSGRLSQKRPSSDLIWCGTKVDLLRLRRCALLETREVDFWQVWMSGSGEYIYFFLPWNFLVYLLGGSL